jgi:hypothetical protein
LDDGAVQTKKNLGTIVSRIVSSPATCVHLFLYLPFFRTIWLSGFQTTNSDNRNLGGFTSRENVNGSPTLVLAGMGVTFRLS